MKKRWITATRCLGVGALALLAAGCATDGDDGKDGADATNLPFFLGLSVAPPSGPAGQFTIDTSGGDGATAAGGSGGDVSVEIDYGSLGGNVLVFRTGVADANFDVPEVVTYLGTNPLEITLSDADTGGNVTIAVVDAEPALGTPYLVDGSWSIYVSDGNGELADEAPVTGLGIAAGVTVTFGLNDDAIQVWIQVPNDVVNRGTLTTVLTGDGDRGGMVVNCDTFYGAAGSSIDLAGPSGGDGEPGGNGGWLTLAARDDQWEATNAAGVIANLGAIDTSGGDGTTGGNAGPIYLSASLWAVNTGDLAARGGTGTAGYGGGGSGISITTSYGNNENSGALDVSGGDGTTDGGDAGYVGIVIRYPGDLRSSGPLTADGGDTTDDGCTVGEGVPCQGGRGGILRLEVHGGSLSSSSAAVARGGAGTAGPGGGGGSFTVTSSKYDQEEGWRGENQSLGDTKLSGNVDVSGGNGTAGGNGGYVAVELDAEYVPALQQIVLYGYTDVVTDGGHGATGGGSAGDLELSNDYSYGDVFDYGPSGAVVNYADVSARGGSGAYGGRGGDVSLWTDDYYGYVTTAELAYNYGDLDLRGGTGTATGGDGGDFYLWGYNAAGNEGAVATSGGAATGDMGEEDPPAAGDAGEVEIYSDLGPVRNTGAIAADGGDATGEGTTYGGDGAKVELVGASLSNTGALSASGGDGATGGDGALVFLYGVFDGTTHSGAIAVGRGSGDTDGYDGAVWIDSMDVTERYVEDPTGPPADG